MKNRVILIACFIHIVLVMCLGAWWLSFDRMIGAESYGIYAQNDRYTFTAESSKKTSVIYAQKNDGAVKKIYKLNNLDKDFTVTDICVGMNNIYVLAERTYDGSRFYEVFQFTDELIPLAKSKVLGLRGGDHASKLSIEEDTLYISAVYEDGKSVAAFAYPVSELVDTEQEQEMSKDDPAVIEVVYLTPYLLHEAQDEETYIDACYTNGSLEYRLEGEHYFSEPLYRSAKYIYDRKNLTVKQALKVNNEYVTYFFIVLILGLVFIFALGEVLAMNNILVNQIILNELLIGTICGLGASIQHFGRDGYISSLILFFIFSSINIYMIYVWHRDVIILGVDIERLSNGRTDFDEPVSNSVAIRKIWNGINEMHKEMQHLKYLKMLSADTYGRFIPNGLEALLKKDSIVDVINGSSEVLEGTMALVSAGKIVGEGAERADGMSNIISLLEKYEVDNDGIILPNDCSLTELKLLFKGNRANCISNILDFKSHIGCADVSVLLYHDTFDLRVVGANHHSMIGVTSPLTYKMQRLAEWLYDKEIRVAFTDEIKKDNYVVTPIRRLGFVEENGSRHDIYELLDAETADMRALKIKQLPQFEKALELFYQNDFYLARSAFSDIIRENQTDEIARWYLFVCEKYLNSDDITEISYELFQ